MGRSAYFTCADCRITYHLGYGSYSTWLDHKADSLQEYDALPDEHKHLLKNKNYRKCLEEHEDHNFVAWSTDWCSISNGNLVSDHDGKILVKDVNLFDEIGLWRPGL
jgi:hypothetical protein